METADGYSLFMSPTELVFDQPQQEAPPQASSSEDPALADFKTALSDACRNATYTCGGRLPILTNPNVDDTGNSTPRMAAKRDEQRVLTKGVTIRWGKKDGGGRVVHLPSLTPGDEAALSQLIEDCTPATFGLRGKDVLDEGYRKAGAMPTDDFMTDFCPYEAGIMDIVTQLLLPQEEKPPMRFVPKMELSTEKMQEVNDLIASFTGPQGQIHASGVAQCVQRLGVPVQRGEPLDRQLGYMVEMECQQRAGGMPEMDAIGYMPANQAVQIVVQRLLDSENLVWEGEFRDLERKGLKEREKRAMSRGLRADLYKLNVYSGPGGMFRKHVDTPRSETQVGSLVVCLPVPFEGGALAVRHHGQEVLHDWSTPSHPSIHWAAFYSDCEHEVLPVTSGHRLTLTYNLFLSPGTGLLNTRPSSLLPTQLPLHTQITKLLSPPHNFLPQGGYLGIHLTHAYPHTHPKLHKLIPQMLKGVDMAIYTALSSYPCIIVPIDVRGNPPSNTLHRLKQKTHPNGPPLPSLLVPFTADENHEFNDGEDTDDAYEHCEDYCFDSDEEGEGEPLSEKQEEVKERAKVGKRIVWVGGVDWGRGEGREVQKAFIAYGNQAELKVSYSSVALVVRIPGLEVRNGGENKRKREGGGGEWDG